MQKHKFASTSLTVCDFVEIFDPQGISAIYSCQFCPSFRIKLMLPFGWALRMPVRPISSSFLKISLPKQSQDFRPYQIQPFHGPH